jgi:hypothetical protein
MRNKIVVAIARELCAFIWAFCATRAVICKSMNILSKRPKGRFGSERGTTFPAFPPDFKGGCDLCMRIPVHPVPTMRSVFLSVSPLLACFPAKVPDCAEKWDIDLLACPAAED